jgi:hypothetical protein
MINTTMTISQPAGFGMPMSTQELTRDRVASVRALPMTTGVVSVPAAGAIVPAGDDQGIQGTAVCGYRHLTDAVAVKGAFPGTSAWSPPI